MNAPTKKLVSLKNGICFSQLCEGLDCDVPSCPDRVTSFAEHCFGKVVTYERWSHRDETLPAVGFSYNKHLA